MSSGEAPAFARGADEVLRAWDAELDAGLTPQEVRRRRARYGSNSLRARPPRSGWRIFLDQFRSLVVLLLLAAAATAAAFTRIAESIAIVGALVINAVVGFFTELRAVRSMEALRRMGRTETTVRRAGTERRIPADDLVPGDVVVLGEGEVVPADLRLVRAQGLQINEAPLTGESVPVPKQIEPVAADAPLAERTCMAYRGTAVTRGEADGLVVATGMDTEVGRISRMVEEAEGEETPLEKRLNRLAHRLIWLVVAIAAVTGVSGVLAGKDAFIMAETAITLAIAAVPEGLPIVSTIALARGMRRMARRHALVKKLASVETLGATSVILSDKTGTLTENHMVVRRLALPGGDVERRHEGDLEGAEREARSLLEVTVLCNDARLDADGRALGDPLELALLAAGEEAGLSREELLSEIPEERQESFDTATKMMATFHREEDGWLIAVKGAPEAVLDACASVASGDGETPLDEDSRRSWLERNERLAADGLRVLAVARGRAGDLSADPYRDLTLLGLVGLYDPPREAVRAALDSCRRAGIRVVMVTGDHPATAANIAQSLGIHDGERSDVLNAAELSTAGTDRILGTAVFARVSPEQKLDLVTAFQKGGHVVAMTGDGVNDAPALEKADIGIAMGQRGTEVAREAADVVLKDDAFESIVVAVEQGRGIFENIRRLIVYLLSGNLGEIIAVGLAGVVRAPLPLLPLQILFINLLFDVFPALALGVSRTGEHVLKEPPRRADEPIITRSHWTAIIAYGGLIAAAVLAAFAYALGIAEMPVHRAVSVSFLTFGFARMLHLFNMRPPSSGIFRNAITRNPFTWAAIGVCVALLLAAVHVPGLSELLAVSRLGAEGWAITAVAAAAPLVTIQIGLQAAGWRERRRR